MQNSTHARLALALLASVTATQPAIAAEDRTEAGLLIGADQLTQGRESWRNESVFVDRKWANGHVGGLRANTTRRFGLNDSQFEVYYSLPLQDKLRAGVELQASPTHQVVARNGAGANVQYEFAKAWLVHGSARQLRYDSVTVDQLAAGIEHYVGNWGAYAGIINSRAYGTDNQTWVGRVSHYYGERNRVNLVVADGREPVNIAGIVSASDVRSANLAGRHWLSPQVALDYSAGVTRQGDFYTRRGASLGITIAF